MTHFVKIEVRDFGTSYVHQLESYPACNNSKYDPKFYLKCRKYFHTVLYQNFYFTQNILAFHPNFAIFHFRKPNSL